MARDTDNIIDNPPEDIEEKAPTDVRSAIRAAFDEHRDGNEEDGEKESSEDAGRQRKQEQRVARKDKEDESDSRADGDKDLQRADKRRSRLPDGEGDTTEPEDKGGAKKEDVKIDPPPYYKVKGKATWDKLAPEDKQTILAREKEVSDGFQQVSQRIRAIEDIERVIAPRAPMIQKLGITPVQTVERLFQWMDALQGPNRVEAFKDLAKSLGVNPNQFATPEANQPEISEDGPPPWFTQFTGVVDQKLSKVDQIQNEIAAQKHAHAANTVIQWAKDKPHYQRVAPLMGQLMQAGIVGLNQDGSVDLDGAYERAIKLDPEVAALIQQEAAAKAETEAQEKAQKDAKEKADKLARARRAGSGLRPAPASGPSVLPSARNSKSNGREDKSVRGSIRAALEELRE